MSNIANLVAAADATVGDDLLDGIREVKVGYPRVLTSLTIVGSTAVADTGAELRVAGQKIGRFYNNATAKAVLDSVKQRMTVPVPANAQVELIVFDAAADELLVDVGFLP